MKNFIYYIITCLPLILACEMDERGQFPVDGIPPGQVTDVRVENLPGGATIHYTIPSDEDLLYVKAIYERKPGEIVEQKASAYASQLSIEGIGKSREMKVLLVAGDRSQNESEPVEVKVNPMDAVIYTILDSIKVSNDFGGVRLNWKNEMEADVVITVSTVDELNEWVAVESFYTNVKVGSGNVRGFESTERLFGVSIRDRWDNVTDTLKGYFTPLYEERIHPEDGFRRWNPPGIEYSHHSETYSLEKLWDDNPSTFYLVRAPAIPYSFTFDIGRVVKFSRIKQYQRLHEPTYAYTDQNVEAFELWGAPTAQGLSDDYESGWVKLGEYTVEKPSGLPLGELTDEDISAAQAGHDFNVDPNAPPVRYIRYVITKNWSNNTINSIAELQFWGSEQ